MKLTIRKNNFKTKTDDDENMEKVSEDCVTENNSVNKMTTKENNNTLKLSKSTEDEPDKELFINSPIFCLFLKLFFLI